MGHLLETKEARIARYDMKSHATQRGPNHWTPPKPTQWQQERKRGPILPMADEHKPALLAILDRMIAKGTGL